MMDTTDTPVLYSKSPSRKKARMWLSTTRMLMSGVNSVLNRGESLSEFVRVALEREVSRRQAEDAEEDQP